jgi:hypothetical protein
MPVPPSRSIELVLIGADHASSADHTSRRRLEMVMSAREDFGVTCEITGLVGVHASDLAEPDFGWAWNRLS